MGLADDLLAGSTSAVTYSAYSDNEPHIIVGSDRFVTVPEELKRIAVQGDHDIETVTFDCPRYWDGHDMSKMGIYINYMTPTMKPGAYLAQNISVDEADESVMHFTWTISGHVTEDKGKIKFLVCVKKTDGDGLITNHWNSELCEKCFISEGLETEETILDQYPDLVTQLLLRMDAVEALATPENMQAIAEEHLDKYLAENDSNIKQQIKTDVQEYLDAHESDIPGQIEQYVDDYFDNHNPWVIVGPDEPDRACLWFDTSKSTLTALNTVNITEGSSGAGVFAVRRDTGATIEELLSGELDEEESVTAEVTEAEEPEYDFNII